MTIFHRALVSQEISCLNLVFWKLYILLNSLSQEMFSFHKKKDYPWKEICSLSVSGQYQVPAHGLQFCSCMEFQLFYSNYGAPCRKFARKLCVVGDESTLDSDNKNISTFYFVSGSGVVFNILLD